MNKMPKKKSHTVRRLLSYVGRGYLIRFFLVLVCILVSAVASVAGSIFLGALIDNYITPLLAMEHPVFTGLLHALLLMACLYVVRSIATGSKSICPSKTQKEKGFEFAYTTTYLINCREIYRTKLYNNL